MSRDKPIFTTKRVARFSSAAHDEVELRYPLRTNEADQRNGEQQIVFYDEADYCKRAKRYGLTIYPKPEPFTDGNFKR